MAKYEMNTPRLVALGLVAAQLGFVGFFIAGKADRRAAEREPASVVVTAKDTASVAPKGEAHWIAPAPDKADAVVDAGPGDADLPALSADDVLFGHVEPFLPTDEPSEAMLPPFTQFEEVSHRIQPGETISKVLADHGVSAAEAEEWIRATREVYNLHRIFVGQRLTMLLDRRTGEIASLQMEIDPRTNLVAKRGESETEVVAAREPIAFNTNLRVVKGRITTSFYGAAAEAGIPDKIISDIAEILGWDINFATDMRPGAQFQVVYEELERAEGARKIAGRVVAVQIDARKRTHEGIQYETPDGKSSYYNREGESLGRDFLRYPVAFTRISSHYSLGRFHPVLKRRKPHYGVDFAAPPGTSIRSVADGEVTWAAWKGGNGRFVKIRHDGVFESAYAHLSRIATGLKPGMRVKKGQVIGAVGSSGLATGPHLHFVMYKHGEYIDPLSANMPRSRSLSGEQLARFKRLVGGIDVAYAKAEQTGTALVLAAATDLFKERTVKD